MKIILEFDDFHHHKDVNCIDEVHKLISLHDDIIINLFTIPLYRGIPIGEDLGWCRDVSSLIECGKVCIAVHGTFHSQEEFRNTNYNQSCLLLEKSKQEFEKAGINFTKVFRGPHWGICEDAVNALIENGYTHLYNHTKYLDLENKMGNKKISFVYYNWNIKDDFGTFENEVKNNIIVAHGHTSNVCGNGIKERFHAITQTISELKDAGELEFIRVTDYALE